MNRLWTVALIALIAAGCARATVAMLDERTAIISGHGSAFNSMAEVQQRTLLTAAKTTQARGFRYFQVVGAANTSSTGTMYIPGQTYTSGTATGTATTLGNTTYGNANYSGTSYSTPGTVVPLFKPGVDVTIRMYRDGEINPRTPGVWDSLSILAVQQ